jgi:hypothetical protein
LAKKTPTKTVEEIEKQLWKTADKLRKNIDAAEYKHIVLGLIFLKYISDAFVELYDKLQKAEGDYAGADPEDKDEYKAENVFFVPPGALVVSAHPGQAAHHRQDGGCRHGRHREGEPLTERRAAQGLTRAATWTPPAWAASSTWSATSPSAMPRAAAPMCWAMCSNTSSANSRWPKAKRAASSTPRAAWWNCWWRCWNPTRAASSTPAAAPAACSCNPKNSSPGTRARSTTSPSTGRRATRPPGGWPR